jgi:hypothetical protein
LFGIFYGRDEGVALSFMEDERAIYILVHEYSEMDLGTIEYLVWPEHKEQIAMTLWKGLGNATTCYWSDSTGIPYPRMNF